LGIGIITIFLFCFFLGCIAGLRSLTAPAAVCWGAHLGWLHFSGTKLAFIDHNATLIIFTLLALPGIALPLLGRNLGPTGMLAGVALAVLYWLLLSIASAAVQGIFVSALYHYAKTKQASSGFRMEDFSMAWQPKS